MQAAVRNKKEDQPGGSNPAEIAEDSVQVYSRYTGRQPETQKVRIFESVTRIIGKGDDKSHMAYVPDIMLFLIALHGAKCDLK